MEADILKIFAANNSCLLKQEHILESQDRAEVDRIKANVEQCRKTLQSLGYAEFTFEDFFAVSFYLYLPLFYLGFHFLKGNL